MSTNNPYHGGPLDVQVLSELANEIFRELGAAPLQPGTIQPSSTPAPGGGAPPPITVPSQSLVDPRSNRGAPNGLPPSALNPRASQPLSSQPLSPQPPHHSALTPHFPEQAQLSPASPLAPPPQFYFLNEAVSHPESPVQPAWRPPEHAHFNVDEISQLRIPAALDVHRIRQDFPILSERVQGKPLVWLDNAATTHKPRSVIERLSHFYQHENSNIHRAAHELAARATDAYEGAREKARQFLQARSTQEIVFVRGATEAINLIAQSWGRAHLNPGDEVIISHLEHHANIVPWQLITEERGAKLRVIPVDDQGQILLEDYGRLLNQRTRLVSVTHVSNALGTITPVQQIIQMAHAVGALALIDGAQAVSHLPVDVQALDADFYVFSGHKVFGPTGIGVLYGKEELLNSLPPWQGGGNMIQDVTFERTVYHAAPARFEAGTGNIADAVGLGAALDYVSRLGRGNIAAYEHQLLLEGTRLLQTVPGLRLIGTAQEKASVLSFVLDGFDTAEVGNALSQEGIAVRSGHHCAQPILRRFGLEATVRPSLAFYNTCAELEALTEVLHRLVWSKQRK